MSNSQSTSMAVKSMSDRAKVVMDEISGVVAQSGLSQWELGFLRNMIDESIAWGSTKQNAVMDSIELKVFGEVRRAA